MSVTLLAMMTYGTITHAQEKTADTKFSIDRGFYAVATNLVISSETEGATISYTLDGSDPRTSESATSGITPVSVLVDPDSTDGKWKATPAVMVRAYAHKDGMLPTDVDTHSYIFISKVKTQGDIRPDGAYVFWNSTEMDPEVIDDEAYRDEIDTALLAIPTWSIVMDHEDLFGTEGIHRGDNLTKDWEMPCSLELIYPATPPFSEFKGFQIDCGIKNQGGGGLWSEGEYDHKQSFGIRFRRQYGAGTLNYPVFENAALNAGSECAEYDKIVLRAGHNKSYGIDYDAVHAVYTRDQLARDLQIDMSGIGGHGTFVHLYLNGIYWGLYNPCERQDNAFSATYFGGNEEDYFCGKGKGGDTSGVDDRYDEWFATVSKSASLSTLLPYCDIDNHADMSMLSAYAVIGDFPQYYYDVGNNPGGQIRFFSWDAEDAFGGDSLRSSDDPNISNLSKCAGFDNMWNNNLEYRMNFADRVYKACFNGGALTDSHVLERWNKLCDSIYAAIVCESARWGDERVSSPRTRDVEWASARAAVTAGTAGKAERLITALRSAGKYPSVNPPLFKSSGTTINVTRKEVSSGFELAIDRDGSSGTVYYTSDGSDPRAEGGAPQGINANAGTTITVNATACIKARTLDGGIWSALHEGVFFVSQDLSALKITEIMYNPQDSLMASGRAVQSITGNASAIDPGYTNRALLVFSAPLPEVLTGDDKVVISGAANPTNNGSFTIAKVIYEGSLGEIRTTKVLLNEALADESTAGMIADFLYSGDRYEFLEIKNTGNSALNLSGVTFTRGINYTFKDGTTLAADGIVVLARNPEDFADRYPGIAPDGAFPASSLQNGGERIELALYTGVRSDILNTAATGDGRGAITFSSVPAGIGEGDRVQVFLSTNYCNNRLFTIQSVEGSIVYVNEPLAEGTGGSKAFFYDVLTSVEYNDRAPWPIPADGYGYSLVPSNPDSSANPDLAAEWRASANPNGSPGTDDPSPEVTIIRVNEALTHTDQPERDMIELYNPNGQPVNLSGWYLTDNLSTPQEWVIPSGTTIPANGYIAFYEGHYVSTNLEFAANEFGSAFSLRATGDEVYLFSPTLGYSHGFSFEGAFNGVGFGRYVTSQGEEHFPSQISSTPLAVNSEPAIGPVVITEIMYNPGADGHEFIELANISPAPVLLYDPSTPTNIWIVGGIGFAFPRYTEIGVGKIILLVRDTITPEAFRANNNIPEDVQIFSYEGKLDNEGETITLRAPDEPARTGTNVGEVPYIIVDRVKYDDAEPWPTTGLPLERIDSRAYGNDVINWRQSESSGGTPGIGGGTLTDPLIAVSRTSINVSIEQGQTAVDETFDIWNSGTNQLDYLVQENSALFSVTPASGSSSSATQKVTHTVSFATASLAEGLHQASITVADNGSGALNGPLSIAVSIVVNPPPSPKIALDTTMLTPSVTEGSNAGSSMFNVWNSGTGTLTYSISDNAAWMTISPSGGTSTNSESRQSHIVTYNTAGLPADDYTGTITVSDSAASNSPQTILVQLTVREPILFTAYNDLSWAAGQIATHITQYTTDSGDGTPPAGSSGLLIDQSTGEETEVTLSVSGGDWNGGNHLTQGLDADPGTDANNLFNAKVSCQGIISYGTSNIQLSFSGMDTNMTYTLALFSNRAEYEDRNSLFTISDVTCFTNESSAGTVRSSQAMPEDSVTIIANNTARGYVAKYSQIDPGADGDMLITIAGTHSYVNALMLFATGSLILDDDHDGMEDGWEIMYFGSTNNPNANPSVDYDQDGMSTLEEYLTGSDPTNAASSLRIMEVSPVPGGDIVVTWQSFPDKVYSMMSANVSPANWITNQNGIVATPPQNSTTISTDSERGYFRVKQE